MPVGCSTSSSICDSPARARHGQLCRTRILPGLCTSVVGEAARESRPRGEHVWRGLRPGRPLYRPAVCSCTAPRAARRGADSGAMARGEATEWRTLEWSARGGRARGGAGVRPAGQTPVHTTACECCSRRRHTCGRGPGAPPRRCILCAPVVMRLDGCEVRARKKARNRKRLRQGQDDIFFRN